MVAFIKSAQTFLTEDQRVVLDYDLCLDSASAEKSTVTLKGDDIPRSRNGDWLILDGAIWRISNLSPGDGVTKAELQLPEDSFSRTRFYTPPPAGTSLGGFIAREFREGWAQESDALYAMPYLDVSASDTSELIEPEADADGMYVLCDYLRSVRRATGVRTVFTPTADRLKVSVRKVAPATAAVVPEDGHTRLKTASFSSSVTAKITTVQPIDTGDVDPDTGEKIFERQIRNWYLSTEGAISETVPVRRARGAWSVLILSEKVIAEESVAAAFAKNNEAHKIEFWSDREDLRVLDEFSILLEGEVVSDVIESVWRKAGESRRLYKSGKQSRSLTEKVRSGSSSGSSSGSRSRSSGSGLQELPVGSVYLTVDPANPADTLGYGAWTRIENCYLFCAGSSAPAGSRGGHETHAISAAELPATVSILDTDKLAVYGGGSIGGSGNYFLRSTEFSVPTEPLGSGTPMALDPAFFAINVWLRKA